MHGERKLSSPASAAAPYPTSNPMFRGASVRSGESYRYSYFYKLFYAQMATINKYDEHVQINSWR